MISVVNKSPEILSFMEQVNPAAKFPNCSENRTTAKDEACFNSDSRNPDAAFYAHAKLILHIVPTRIL